MKSENGETEKLQVVNGKILQPLMALESILAIKSIFIKSAFFNKKIGRLLKNRPNFDRKRPDFDYF